MKTIFLILTTILATESMVPTEIQERWVKDASPYYDDCLCETGADKVNAVKILKNLQYPDESKLKCFAKCVEIKMGLMTLNGKIIPEAWVQKVAGVTFEIASKCTNNTNLIKNSCQKAYMWSQCLVEEVSSAHR